MSNTYYTKALNAVPDTLIRASAVNNEYAALELAFDRAEVKLLASLRGPDGDSLAAMPTVAERANKSLVFDALGNPIATVSASSAEMAAAVVAADSAADSAIAAAASAATVAGSTNALHLLQLNAGIL